MVEAAVCHLLKGEGDERQVLFGKRINLFLNGFWIGPGGKRLKREKNPVTTAARETLQEIGVEIDRKSATHFATIDFYHPEREGHVLGMRVSYFWVTAWKGEPRPIKEFSELKWFHLKDLPYDKMLPDREVWLPVTLNGAAKGRKLEGEVYYADSDHSAIEKWSCRFVPAPVKARRRTSVA